MRLIDQFRGALLGGAIGDALGVPAEKRTPEEIRARWGEIRDFVEPWDRTGTNPRYRGDGNITDDSLMMAMLCRVYLTKREHLDAYDAAEHLVPLLLEASTFVPEYGRAMPLIERLFYPEKYLYLRLKLAQVEPREGGLGNMVNCGAAMYVAPIGLMNAGNPRAAYAEAIDFAAAHQWSYGREAAGVFAACVAAAAVPDADIDDALAAALTLARDGTRSAIVRALDVAHAHENWRSAVQPLQAALLDYMPGGWTADRRPSGLPSRTGAIEELPAALALLSITRGQFTESVIAAANYGHDADSIAIMAGCIAGALNGADALPLAWVDTIRRRNQIDFAGLGDELHTLFVTLAERDDAAHRHRLARLGLAGEPVEQPA